MGIGKIVLVESTDDGTFIAEVAAETKVGVHPWLRVKVNGKLTSKRLLFAEVIGSDGKTVVEQGDEIVALPAGLKVPVRCTVAALSLTDKEKESAKAANVPTEGVIKVRYQGNFYIAPFASIGDVGGAAPTTTTTAPNAPANPVGPVAPQFQNGQTAFLNTGNGWEKVTVRSGIFGGKVTIQRCNALACQLTTVDASLLQSAPAGGNVTTTEQQYPTTVPGNTGTCVPCQNGGTYGGGTTCVPCQNGGNYGGSVTGCTPCQNGGGRFNATTTTGSGRQPLFPRVANFFGRGR
jgi:hypothetical protein